MKIYSLKTKQKLKNVSLSDTWIFFSNPKNLNEITPEDMKFEILTDLPNKVYPGMLIQYYVQPFKFFKTSWVTEITACEDETYFIDEQRFGPYKFWHHLHKFEKTSDGVLMEDELHYILPAGIFNFLISSFIQKKVQSIFDYRYKKLESIFNQS